MNSLKRVWCKLFHDLEPEWAWWSTDKECWICICKTCGTEW